MRDVELYKTILGLTPPWAVIDVTLDVKGQRVTVRVHAGDGPFPCPGCHATVPGYGKKPRRWRHLDTCQFTTWIAAIAMDMWEPYIQSTLVHLDDAPAKIVFDKFHIAKHLHDAVDQVRKAEHRALQQAQDDRLTGTKVPLAHMCPQAMTDAQRAIFLGLQRSDLKVARAWALKERFRQFWNYTYRGAAQTFFTRRFWRATHSRLNPMAAVAKLIQRHLPNVLTYLQHRLTNAGLEAVNATIQWVKKTARGFRNVEHFKTAIYFHCGGLDLYPHESR